MGKKAYSADDRINLMPTGNLLGLMNGFVIFG